MPSASSTALALGVEAQVRSRIACAIAAGLYLVSLPFCLRIASAMAVSSEDSTSPREGPVRKGSSRAVPALVPSSAATAAAMSAGL